MYQQALQGDVESKKCVLLFFDHKKAVCLLVFFVPVLALEMCFLLLAWYICLMLSSKEVAIVEGFIEEILVTYFSLLLQLPANNTT